MPDALFEFEVNLVLTAYVPLSGHRIYSRDQFLVAIFANLDSIHFPSIYKENGE